METVTCACFLVIPAWLEAWDTSSRPPHWLPLSLATEMEQEIGRLQWLGSSESPAPPPPEPAGSCCFQPEEEGKEAAKDVAIVTAFLSALLGVNSCLLCS